MTEELLIPHYEQLLRSEAWKEMVSVLEERRKELRDGLAELSNSHERDFEIKVRLAEIEYVLSLPILTVDLAKTIIHLKGEQHGPSDKNAGTSDQAAPPRRTVIDGEPGNATGTTTASGFTTSSTPSRKPAKYR